MKNFARYIGLAIASVAYSSTASASGGGQRQPLDPGYVSECGSCHVPYPPRSLGADSWAAVLKGLSDHFKVDASLDPASLDSIGRYLNTNARRKPAGDTANPPLRISETRWFVHEHDEVSEAQWSKVKSRSNCGACHANAQQGRYSEHELKLPH